MLDAASGNHADTRNKAVRLIANKLFAQPQLQDSIQSFARQMLFQLLATALAAAATAEATIPAALSTEQPHVQDPLTSTATPNEPPSDPQITLPLQQQLQYQSEEEGTQFSGLYCALCTKKQTLLRDLLLVYGKVAEGCKVAIEAVSAGISSDTWSMIA